jgi:hypothetical protein
MTHADTFGVTLGQFHERLRQLRPTKCRCSAPSVRHLEFGSERGLSATLHSQQAAKSGRLRCQKFATSSEGRSARVPQVGHVMQIIAMLAYFFRHTH